jgi:hypothetical protein
MECYNHLYLNSLYQCKPYMEDNFCEHKIHFHMNLEYRGYHHRNPL